MTDYGRLLRGDPRHGTRNGYGTYRCRCNACVAAEYAYRETQRRNRAARGLAPYDERHGTPAGYCAGCRCERCSEAKSAYNADLRQKRADS